MNKVMYENLLFKSVVFNTSNKCYSIEGELNYFLIKFIQKFCQKFAKTHINVYKYANVLHKRNESPYYEKNNYVGYRWFSEPINVSTNMCIYVEIHKDDVKKVLI